VTLDEILAEGEYVIEKWAPEGTVLREVQGVPIRVAVLERLLAVARAAVEKDAAHKAWSEIFMMRPPPPLSVVIAADERRKAANAAFDAAAGEVPR